MIKNLLIVSNPSPILIYQSLYDKTGFTGGIYIVNKQKACGDLDLDTTMPRMDIELFFIYSINIVHHVFFV